MPVKLIKNYSRRSVLKIASATTLAFNFFPRRVFGANDRIAVAGIGAGGKGHAPLSRFEVAGPYTEVVLLGNLAIRANQPVEWNPEKGQANSDKANSFVRQEYRKGWGW